MITYELAKQLKDAGFRAVLKAGDLVFCVDKIYVHLGGGHNGNEGLYAEKGFTCCLDEYEKSDSDLNIGNSIKNFLDEQVVLLPTLSELIGACGKNFIGLDRMDEGWRACGAVKSIIYMDNKTPEEAVANLWLAINKKQ